MKSKLGRGLPSLAGRSESAAFDDTEGTGLGAAVARLPSNGKDSGVHLLPEARQAFAARMVLARTAERSLDLQYYIWDGDLTGTLLFQAVNEAAERGVRVRLLLDDNNTQGLNAALAWLDMHEHIEVRLFNPYTLRRMRWLNGLLDFRRLNHRMHNKSFTADNQVTIIGGRNIGDAYFGATEALLFTDLDVLLVGPVAQAASADFDRYWRCSAAVPLERLLPAATPEQRALLMERAAQIEHTAAASAYVDAVRSSDFVQTLKRGTIEMQWVPTSLLSDDPAKALGKARPATLFSARLASALGRPQSALDLVSAYFVPGAGGVAELSALANAGVRVRVLTNALETTDVAVVHAGYSKRRKALLRAGVALYELKCTPSAKQQPRERGQRPSQPQPEGIARPRRRHLGGSGGGGSGGGSGIGGSSAASLHAKTFIVDRKRLFVGSFNFDPRSALLNTELGVVIESPPIAARMATAFDEQIEAYAYEVQLEPGGRLVWIEHGNAGTVRHRREPGTPFIKRCWVGLLSLMPIEWML